MLYKNAEVVLVVFNITDLNSYKEATEYWIKEIKTNLDSDVFFAIFCKIGETYEYQSRN